MEIEVLARATWLVHWGGINHLGGISGQVTKCRYGGIVFYVRENLALDHFNISAGERQALKCGRIARRHSQVLELLAPAVEWNCLAKLVHEADTMRRSVRRNRNFTWAWAGRTFAQAQHLQQEQTAMRMIEVIVSPKGETSVQTKGYAGADCLQGSKFLLQALGVVGSDQRTAEYYVTTQSEQQVQQ